MGQVSLRGIRKRCGKVDVITGIDIENQDGAFMVFVGPSGGGKSTLLRMIADLETVTGGDNMGLALKMAGVSRERRDKPVRHAAEAFRIDELLGRCPKQPSGGPLRAGGVPELLAAKVGIEHARFEAGQTVGLAPDATWAPVFGADGRLL